MKSKLSIIFALLFAACGTNKNEKKTTVQGLYVTQFQTEYSKAMDTIDITPLNSEAGTFNYVRRVGYRRISNGVLGPMEHKTENSTCVFNQETAQLHEQRHGRIYSLSSDGNQLISGNSVYRRIQ
jgi:hypothetical protein